MRFQIRQMRRWKPLQPVQDLVAIRKTLPCSRAHSPRHVWFCCYYYSTQNCDVYEADDVPVEACEEALALVVNESLNCFLSDYLWIDREDLSFLTSCLLDEEGFWGPWPWGRCPLVEEGQEGFCDGLF